MKVKGFHWTAKSYYARSLSELDKQSINFGIYDTDGGCVGEMQMVWIELEKNIHSPKIECYDDSFQQLIQFSNIFKILSNKENFTQEEFVKVLLENGFKDLTKYELS